MDPITHGLLGATLGQSFFSRTLKRKAIVFGGLVAMLPDLDLLYHRGPLNHFMYHRGYTHAFFIQLIAGLLLGLLASVLYTKWARSKGYRKKDIPSPYIWCALFVVALWSHALLDYCTTYGTQLWLPFTNKRYALDAIAVIDPYYSGIILITVVLGLIFLTQKKDTLSRWFGRGGLVLSTAVLLGCYYGNIRVVTFARDQIKCVGHCPYRVKSYPVLFHHFVRQVLVETDEEIRIGYASLLNLQPLKWFVLKKLNTPEITDLKTTDLGPTYFWFTEGLVAPKIETLSDGRQRVTLMDMRFVNPLHPPESIWGLQADYKEGQRISEMRFVNLGPSIRALMTSLSLKEAWTLWQNIGAKFKENFSPDDEAP